MSIKASLIMMVFVSMAIGCDQVCHCCHDVTGCLELNPVAASAAAGGRLKIFPHDNHGDTWLLRSLFICNGNVTIVTNNSLVSAQRVEELHLVGNGITTIETSAFRGLRHLRVLFLQNNALRILPKGSLDTLVSLTTLNLRKNLIQELPKDLFRFTVKLRHLDLSHNRLSSLHVSTFKGLFLLEKLNLHYNAIHTIQYGTFDSLINLRVLLLQNNDLSTLPPDLFQNTSKLSTLDLSGNKIRTFDVKLVSALKNISIFNTSGNPLHCECVLEPFQRWLLPSATKWPQSALPVCHTPIRLVRRLLLTLHTTELCPVLAKFSTASEKTRVDRKKELDALREKLMPYNPMMGVGTAATLSGMLLLFLLCLGFDKLKRMLKQRYREKKRKRKEMLEYTNPEEIVISVENSEALGESPKFNGIIVCNQLTDHETSV